MSEELATEELTATFESAIEKRVFPGASCWLSRGDTVFAHQAFGTTAYDAEYSRPATRDTAYDIASITKLFTTAAFFIASRESGTSIECPLAQFFPQFQTGEKAGIRLRHLMQHNSGIEIAIQSLIEFSPEEWIARIVAAPLQNAPAQSVRYSCTNFFLLARVVEKISGAHLDDLIAREILQPLRMNSTAYFPLRKFSKDNIAPTEIQNQNLTQGIVHDEAARAWQEYSHHASCGNSGLFSTSGDLAKFARLWLNDGAIESKQIIAREDVEKALNETVLEADPIALRGLGFQINAPFFMSHKAPPDAAGHTGFTGPTLWFSRATRDVCIILNNRVYPARESPSRFPTHRRVARWLMNASSESRA
jgi:CubicO group peptidase (beta-lactamase class C family)